MHWLAFYSHMENTWMAALFHLTPPIFIEMPYHSRKNISHAYVCLGYRCCLFLQFYYWFSERVYFSTWSFFRYHRHPFVHFIWHLITLTHSFTLQLFDTKCHIFLLFFFFFIYTCHFKINSFTYWFVCIKKRYLLRNYFLSSERCINYWRVDTLSQTNTNLSSYLILKLFNSIICTKIKLGMK